MIKAMALLMFVSLAGTVSAQATHSIHSLGANGAIPNQLIESQLDDETARAILATPYAGFYQIKSKVEHSKLTFFSVVPDQSFPDGRWMDLARGIAGLIEIPVYSTGSRIIPKATAYVAFYDVDIPALDRDRIMHLPTSVEKEPNMLAVLVIKHQNHSQTKGVSGTQTSSSDTNGNHIYFFELAM